LERFPLLGVHVAMLAVSAINCKRLLLAFEVRLRCFCLGRRFRNRRAPFLAKRPTLRFCNQNKLI
jgi:hypothetical protein